MAKRLYVGNLSYDTNEEGLREEFEKIGELASVTLITDRESGRSRGFGFVEFANDEDADKAVEMYGDKEDPKELDGRNIVVNVAREREDRR